ncbi:MAG TPA: Bax inhibitor-1/YccA family protein [Chitinophagaceae bacterium]|nr:Bax inhibitor-1/YccA family protein [Chitinophagaceae bacterium]
MEYQNPQHGSSTDLSFIQPAEQTQVKNFIANVFAYMFVALGISALFAYLFAANPSLLQYLVNPTGTGLNMLGYAVLFAPLGFVLLMSFGYSRLSAPVLILLFVLYAAINGISFGFILLSFTSGTVLACFLSAAAMFGIMAFMGYTTKQDLTKFGRIMIMGLIGIIVASLINLFMHNSTMDYLISFIGVMIFTGLTAYDVQKLKNIGAGMQYADVPATDVKRASILGALTLYLDFINLFLFLLRLFGGRRN